MVGDEAVDAAKGADGRQRVAQNLTVHGNQPRVARQSRERLEVGVIMRHLAAACDSLAQSPYLSRPRPAFAGYGEYDHLARVKEWAVAYGED